MRFCSIHKTKGLWIYSVVVLLIGVLVGGGLTTAVYSAATCGTSGMAAFVKLGMNEQASIEVKDRATQKLIVQDYYGGDLVIIKVGAK